MFEIGKEYREQDMVTDLTLQKDGTLTGTIPGTDAYYRMDFVDGTVLEYIFAQPKKEHRALVSLRTGRRHCSCPYSRVDVCGHVAALLICAAKDLKVTVPAGGLPIRRRSSWRTTMPYREDADRILVQAANPESADAHIDRLLELAEACRDEGDLTEALLVCLGITEALLSGLDYQAYSEYFRWYPDIPDKFSLPSIREPEGIDAMRVRKFCEVFDKGLLVISGARMLHEQKAPCIAATHRLYLKTNPWGPSNLYSIILAVSTRTDKDYKFLKGLHDPAVPKSTPDPREDPVGFRAVMNLARRQSTIYEHLKDYSLLEYYARHYRDDPGTCARYAMCLRHMKQESRAEEVKAKGMRLFPGVDVWSASI